MPHRIVHAAPALAAWIATHVDRPLLVGPDDESQQWVADVSSRAGAPSLVLRKIWHADRVVEVSMPDIDAHRTRTPVVVDDIVSSAQTMVETVKRLVAAGLRAPVRIGAFPHERSKIGWEGCHGGNPRTFEALPAHAGILRSADATSPVNRRNLPTTYGVCHTGPFVAFSPLR